MGAFSGSNTESPGMMRMVIRAIFAVFFLAQRLFFFCRPFQGIIWKTRCLRCNFVCFLGHEMGIVISVRRGRGQSTPIVRFAFLSL